MEIRDRIQNCLTALDERRQQMAIFEVKVGALIEALRANGETPGALGEVLAVLEAVLRNYREINLSCRQMIDGLREIGDHLDRIEDGRRKIVTGVETILKNLAQLDELARQGMQFGVTPEADGDPSRPKRVLLIRIRPDQKPGPSAAARSAAADEVNLLDDDELGLTRDDGAIVH